MMKKPFPAFSSRTYPLVRAAVNETASNTCKLREIPAVCTAAMQHRRAHRLVFVASRSGYLESDHEPTEVTWDQVRSGLKEVLADLWMDGAQASSGT